jgi:hypothetical protein
MLENDLPAPQYYHSLLSDDFNESGDLSNLQDQDFSWNIPRDANFDHAPPMLNYAKSSIDDVDITQQLLPSTHSWQRQPLMDRADVSMCDVT